MPSRMLIRTHRWPLIAAASTLALVACGGDDSATTEADIAIAEEAPATSLPEAPTTSGVPVTLPSPDAEWAAQVIEAYDEFLAGDIDRTLPYIEGLDSAPDREVELYGEFLRSDASAVDALLAQFPSGPADPALEGLLETFIETLEARRDLSNEVATELDTTGAQVQAELDAGGSERYSELRRMFDPAGDQMYDACFALQAELDQRQLGVLTCLPGPPDGDPPTEDAAARPQISLGPDARPVMLEFEFDLDSPDSEGQFTVTDGAGDLDCTAGTWIDTDLSTDNVQLTKQLTCVEGDRAGTITVHQWFDGSDVWTIEVADGDFAGIAGVGTFSFDPDTMVEGWTGEIEFTTG